MIFFNRKDAKKERKERKESLRPLRKNFAPLQYEKSRKNSSVKLCVFSVKLCVIKTVTQKNPKSEIQNLKLLNK